MKNLFVISTLLLLTVFALSDTPKKIYTKADIEKLAGVYLNNGLNIKNPAIVDVDKDGIFDILNFKDGNVEYYRNTGTIEQPVFILENAHYDKYQTAFFMDGGMPMPVFFADADGDGDMDLFAVRDKVLDKEKSKYDYKIYYSTNDLNIDTGTLITIILILVVVLLILAILGR